MCATKREFLAGPVLDHEVFMSGECCRFIFQKCVVGNRINVFLWGARGKSFANASCLKDPTIFMYLGWKDNGQEPFLPDVSTVLSRTVP